MPPTQAGHVMPSMWSTTVAEGFPAVKDASLPRSSDPMKVGKDATAAPASAAIQSTAPLTRAPLRCGAAQADPGAHAARRM